MSSDIYKVLTCDRCSMRIDLKHIETKELDGGYSKYEQFEDKPSGWTRECCKDLCPDCSGYLKEIMNDFWKDIL